MKTIHKYAIEPGRRVKFILPGNAKVLFVSSQLAGTVHFWVELDLAAEESYERTFQVHGTGAAIPDDHHYVGSVYEHSNVWHLYEKYDINKTLTPQAEAVFDPPDVVEQPKNF